METTPDWKKLSHAQGAAKAVPSQAKKLAGRDAGAAETAFGDLCAALVRRGQWFDASAPTVALLLDALPRAKEKDLVLVLLAEIAGADHARAWIAPSDDAIPEDVQAAVVSRKQALFDALASKERDARAAALVALATLPALAAEALPLVRARAATDPEEIVRASALIALGRLGAGDPESAALIDKARAPGSPPLVRGAAALAWLRQDPARRADSVATDIEAWLTWPGQDIEPDAPQLPWFGGLRAGWYSMTQRSSAVARGLAELARARGDADAVVALVLRIGQESASGLAARRAGEVILDLGGFRELRPDRNNVPSVALPEELSPAQRAIAEKLAATMLLPAAGHGLPAAGACRRRWIGQEPAGPLEAPVEIELDGAKRSLPLWRAYADIEARRPFPPPLPPQLDGLIAGLPRWQALVELAARSYGCMEVRVIAPAALARELGAVPHDDAFFALAARLADDLAARFAAGARAGAPLRPDFPLSALLLLPFVRAGRPLDPRWDALVHVGAQPEAREILAALPPERREAIVWESVRGAAPNAIPGIQEAIAVLDLAPSQRIGENLLRRLANPAVKGFFRDKADTFLARVRELAEREPGLREALAATT